MLCWWLWLAAPLLANQAWAAAPSVWQSYFPLPPAKFSYFRRSDIALYFDSYQGKVYRSADAGKSWSLVSHGVPQGSIIDAFLHPHDPNVALLLTGERTHYRTDDKGASWTSFKTPSKPSPNGPTFRFHATRPGYILYTGEECLKDAESHSETCQDRIYYTKTGFASSVEPLPASMTSCMWAHSNPHFDTMPAKTIYCVEYHPTDSAAPQAMASGSLRRLEDHRFVVSEDFFRSQSLVTFAQNRPVKGVIGFTEAGKFLTVVVKHPGSTETSLFVTNDGRTWSEAHLPHTHGWQENGYTVLDSTPHALLVEVHQGDSQQFGSLFRSNSEGSYFTLALDHVNMNADGLVDFERVGAVEGIALANTVYNWEAVRRNPNGLPKKLQSHISFDDGAHWRFLKPPPVDANGQSYLCASSSSSFQGSEACALHLHSLTASSQSGPLYSSTGAPGLLLGVGNVGTTLLPYTQCDTFLSTDGGLTWSEVRKDAHLYEFGDSGALMALVNNEKPTDHIWYSADRGQSWVRYNLGLTLRAEVLTTDPDSTSQSFVLMGRATDRAADDKQFVVLKLDFSNFYSRQCQLDEAKPSGADFEKWYARSLESGPDCLMGHKTTFWRVKPAANCYVGRKFEPAVPVLDNCPCTEEDYECDYHYVWDDATRKCVTNGPEVIPSGQCRHAGDRYQGSSGYRRVPGNTCDYDQGQRLDEPVDKPCPSVMPTPDGQATHQTTLLHGDVITFFYFNQSSTAMLLSGAGELWRSPNEGATWSRVLGNHGNVVAVVPHRYDSQRVYAVLADDQVFFSVDQGQSFAEIHVPVAVNKLNVDPFLQFHPTYPDWLLFVGGTPCPKCHTEVYFTETHTSKPHWLAIDTFANQCHFAHAIGFTQLPTHTVFCLSYRAKHSGQEQDVLQRQPSNHRHNPLQLVRFDPPQKTPTVVLDYAVDLFTFDRYMAVTVARGTSLALFVSVDGTTFKEAQFPPQVSVTPNQFTLFQTATGAVFVDVLRSTDQGQEYGSLFVSNLDGTYYNLVLTDTNRDHTGLVDFEPVPGVQGIVLANRVANADALGQVGQRKAVQSMVSFTDGRTWARISAPLVDAREKRYECGQECYVNLHGYTDVTDADSMLKTAAAPGLMVAVGSVGPQLAPYEQSNTFITANAGRSWKEIRRGPFRHALGDHGALVVLVNDATATNQVVYSWDRGATWSSYVFSDHPVRVTSLITAGDATSLKFLITGYRLSTVGDHRTALIALDFSGTTLRRCTLNIHESDPNDFELWTPGANVDERCHMGKEVSYWRRKANALCTVGGEFTPPPTSEKRCACVHSDFECDDHFWRNDKGQCQLYGVDPKRPAVCPSGSHYVASPGYRKLPTSLCQGGIDLTQPVEKPCDDNPGIHHYTQAFTSAVTNFYYFNRSPHLLLRTLDGELWVSLDEGISWKLAIALAPRVVAIIRQPYVEQRAYAITNGATHYHTVDRGHSFTPFTVPAEPSLFSKEYFSFHPDHPDWMLYMGSVGCESLFSTTCHEETFVTRNHGVAWTSVHKYTRGCQWAKTPHFSPRHTATIFCEVYANPHGSQFALLHSQRNFVSTADDFATIQLHLENTAHYAVVAEYLAVAVRAMTGHSLQLHISLDGTTFALARFPGDVHDINKAYTVLDSTTHSLFLHVTTHSQPDAEFGTLFTSNSNGTYFTTALANVNRNGRGLVDFEKMEGIDGIALTNRLANPKEVVHGAPKKLTSVITFDDGARWHTLEAPKADSLGRVFDCPDCALHLHSFTVVQDPENIYSSSSAVGLMVGVGNVGPHLLPYRDGDTFLTRDGGLTWREIRKGAHLHEFGDHGAILLLVDDEAPTDHVWYSLNEGKSFSRYTFAPTHRKQRIVAMTTEPQSTSRKFLLLGLSVEDSAQFYVTTLDFTGVEQRKCVLDINHEESDDFELWSPTADRNGQCLFGREVQYYRRLGDRDCYIGHEYEPTTTVVKNCTCTEHDFECDYNFVRNPSTGRCELVPGLEPPTTECKPNQAYHELSTGYRKIPMSTCHGGVALDEKKRVYCPGEAATVTLHWVLGLPLLVAVLGGVGWYVYRHHRRGSIWVALLAIPGVLLMFLWSIDWQCLTELPRALWERVRGVGAERGNGARYTYEPVQQDEPMDVFAERYDDYFDHYERERDD